ncbi:MAG TPA: hypothetical protein VFY27_01710, partial [Woeseiaceae bacterium]|nr:hypothetical protein [Woeseiaceae bacterium]
HSRTTGSHAVDFVHRHNLVQPDAIPREKRFGIRVTLPPGDTFTRLLGEDWERFHWYESEVERDAAFRQMAIRHGYYRKSDAPTQILQKLVR